MNTLRRAHRALIQHYTRIILPCGIYLILLILTPRTLGHPVLLLSTLAAQLGLGLQLMTASALGTIQDNPLGPVFEKRTWARLALLATATTALLFPINLMTLYIEYETRGERQLEWLVWLGITIPPLLFLWTRFSLAPLHCAAQRETLRNSLARAWRITEGRNGLCYGATMGGLALANLATGPLLAWIPHVIYGIPLMATVMGITYQSHTQTREGGPHGRSA